MEKEIQVYKEALKKAANKITELDEQVKQLQKQEEVAIIGYDCRFPGGANDPEKFWELLVQGYDAVTEITPDRFDVNEFYSSDKAEKGKMFTRNAALLDGNIREFDNTHFELSAKEASSIDPQQRLLLEISWNALEHAGIDIESLKGSRTGVFVGLDSIEYFKAEVFSGDEQDITPYSLMGVSQHSAAGRLSYFYDLKGPAVMCNTACSSSLVALNLAVQSLKNGQCDLAIVGGVNLLLTPSSFVGLSQFQALSPDGRCKTFDESADGFGCGEGCGVVILKRLSDAKRDKNMVAALVKGIAVGQDGRANGFFAPNGLAEQMVIKQALKDSKCTVDDVDYIEAHGTGTILGDTIEAQSVSDVFRKRREPIYIGTVKSNIAHLEAAAGMASLIKVILSMKHKMLPASIHCSNPNHNIDWSKIRVVQKLTEWKKASGKRTAGISGFGISGTLVHVIIQEPEELEENLNLKEIPCHLLMLSAKSKKALRNAVTDIRDYIEQSTNSVNDIAYTSSILKSRLQYRFACVGENKEELMRELNHALEKEEVFEYHSRKTEKKKKKIAFLFTGQGSIYKNIASQLYEYSDVFREVFDSCEAAFEKLLSCSIKGEVFGSEKDNLTRPLYSQPVIFSIEYALAQFWMAAGIKPDVVIGHSIGEYAASCISGLLTFEDAVQLISIRAKIMDQCSLDGKMAGILADYDSVEEALMESGCKNVSIAAVNAPTNVTISGLKEEVDKVIETLHKKKRAFIENLQIFRPYHSHLMKAYEDDYMAQMGDIQFAKPKIDMISSVTGKIEKEDVLGNKEYWAQHLAKTVDFQGAMKEAEAIGVGIFLEIGGNATLCGLGSQCISSDNVNFIPSLRFGTADYKQLLMAAENMYLAGVSIDWEEFYKSYQAKRVALPNYPFQRKELWKELNNHAKAFKVENEIEWKEDLKVMNNVEKVDNKLLRIDAEIKEMIQMISGLEINEIEPDKELFSLGFDSLLMMTLGKQLSKTYKVEIPISEFFTSVNTLEKIESYIAEHGILKESEEVVGTKAVQVEVPAQTTESMQVQQETTVAMQQPAVSYQPEVQNGYVASPVSSDFGLFKSVFENQYRIMAEQNEIMKGLAGMGRSMNATPSFQQAEEVRRSVLPEKKNKKVEKPNIVKETEQNYYVPYHKLELTEESGISQLQMQYLKNIEEKYTTLTRKSKENIQNYRGVYANARNSAGFRPLFKEMLYQVIAERGKGSKFIDLDGNEFVDVTMGFGVDLFGHAPDFVKDALCDELEHGMPLGPMGRLPGEVSRKISLLTGMERIFFCNSGTEADMFAIRLARAVTGRKKIVAFTGAYHGTYDGLLGLPAFAEDGTIYSIPQAPGITEHAVEDLILLSYNSERSLQYIEKHADEIAGVIVETVQSRRPDIQPKEFLLKLRALTKEKDMALIFDEVITGFRISAGGAQEYFGIQADIVTYGKVVGGGMPIGIVSGIAKYMDSVDGGMWKFGDDSVPPYEEKRTYVAGTFCHHPMAMASANAVLDYILAHKDTMYKELNDKTDAFADEINSFFKEEKVPFTMIHFGSLFRFTVAREYEIFYYGLLEKGIYIWEGRNCFLSTEHSKEDIAKIVNAVKETVKEMKKAGYFGTDPEPEKVLPSSSKNVMPMSMIQERLYSQIVISEADPFDILAVFTIKTPINIEKLQQAVNTIIQRHEILRTSMYMENGAFMQKVMEQWEFKVREITKTEECDIDELISNSIVKFDLSKPPLIEVLFIRVMEKEPIIVFHFHHTAADGISMNNFVQELTALYNDIPLEPMKKQYKDFVEWENKYVHSKALQDDKEYWLNRLSGIPCSVSITHDFPNQVNAGYAGFSILDKINQEELVKLKAIAKENGASLFMILLSIVNVLMHKISRENQLAVITPVANRFDGGFEDCIGMYTNTIALSSEIEEDQPFEQYLQNVKKECLESYAHVNYPYNMLIDELNAVGQNVFNIMFVYENTDARSLDQISELQLEEYPYVPKTQEFDLTFELLEKNGCIDVYLRYRTDLYSEASMRKMLECFLFVMNQVIDNPAIRFSDIATVTEEEKEQILYKFNQGDTEYPKEDTIVTLFEKQVIKMKEQIAVVYGDQKITYQELNQRANAVAKKLRELGTGPDDFIAILAERSIEMIIGIFGILKAGGAYVPIDPSYPSERISYTLNDCKPKAVLVYHMDNAEKVCGKLPILDLETFKYSEEIVENLPCINEPHNAAYVIYTSGTTGRPKGVVVEHVNIVRLLYNDGFQYDFGAQDVWTMFHSYCFDFSVWEIFGALLYGGKLVVLSKETVKDSIKVRDAIRKNGVTVLNQVPTAFYSLLAVDDGISMASVRYLIFGGEALNPARLKEWHKNYKNAVIVNMYGITETTVHVTYREIGDVEIEKGVSDIGRAIPTLSVYVMNQDSLCGIGIPGELCVAGAGVARGYLNRPELQNEKFIQNPFGEGKLYRSGDLVRWMPDGNLEYLGRIDEQVKIRGFRIELKEIENVIRNIDYVKDAAVITRKDASGENLILAYIVSDEKIHGKEIRSIIGKSLPEYMVPSYFLQIDRIPVTRNGKLDRNALPEIKAESEMEYVAPTTELEEKLCRLFGEILGLEKVGIQDDFFAIGGHSLRATRLMNRIETEIGCRLSVRVLFQSHTVEELSREIEQAMGIQSNHIPRAEKKEYYPMSSTQKRTYLIWKLSPEEVAYNMTCCFKISGGIDEKKAEKALQTIINRHEILRTEFLDKDGEMLQRVKPSAKLDFNFTEDSKTSEADVINAFIRPFDLGSAPLLRAGVVRREDHDLFLMDTHHIVGDGMSLYIIINEFMALYNGQKVQPLIRQYKDYSEWMRKKDLSLQESYWLNMFQGEIPILDMPYDYPRPQIQSFQGATVSAEIESELAGKLRKITKETGTTEYMVFLSAAMILLSKYARQEDVVIGTPISGRTHEDMESMLGMFVNTLAMRGQPEAKKTVRKFLEEMRDACLKAYDNQEYPFEQLVESIDVKRDMSRNPLFDVLLVLQNNEEAKLVLDGKTAEVVEQENTVAKFDLTFNIYPMEDTFRLKLEYDKKLYKKTSADYILHHYIVVLEQIAEHLDDTLGEIEMIDQTEHARILKEFNDTKTDYPRDKSIKQLLEEQVVKTPDNTAVVFGNTTLTYKELNEKANQVAYSLVEQGVEQNDFVVIMAEKSIEMIVGICGIIKAGAAYVPLDASYPVERIQYMIQDCKPKVVLTYQTEVEIDFPVIDLSEAEVWEHRTENLNVPVKWDNLCYCIYTSGTTGKPKGSLILHRGVVRLVKGRYLAYGEEDAFLQTGSISFDASTIEIWATLLNGGKLVVTPQEDIIDCKKLKEQIEKHRITYLWITATLFNQMIQADVTVFDSLKYVMTGGEKISDKHVKMLREHNASIQIINGYGPTENTTFTTTYSIKEPCENIPIGKPISNTQVYVVNGGKLCGIGVPGELCTAGDGLSKGYLNRPELTEEKFRDNPFGEGKLYYSGDLVRWMEDGNLEFIGRIDEQVKVRGFRVELTEIENTLRTIDFIEDAVVIAKANQYNTKAIYAYVVSEQEVDIAQVREILGKKMPDYMVPAYMMQIDEIPLTANGKANKKALPEIEAKSEEEYVAPQTKEESILCSVLSETLGVGKVGVKDSFFELGGDSIKAIRVVSKLREAGYDISFKEIMHRVIVEEIAGAITSSAAVQYEQGEVVGNVIPTPILKQFAEWKLEEPHHFNQAVMITLKNDDVEVIQKVLDALVLHHDILRAVYHENTLTILSSQESKKYDFEVIEVQENDAERIETECNRIQASIDLEHGSLMKVALFRTEKGTYLMFCLHHLIVDGVSWRILLEDFQTALKQVQDGVDINLPAKTASFLDWGEALEEYKNSSQLKLEKDYWENVVKNMQDGSVLGNDKTKKKGYESLTFTLSEELTDKLIYEAGKAYNTEINDILITALGMAVNSLTGQDKVAVKMEGHGREEIHKKIDIDRTIGWFTSVYPIVVECKDDMEEAIIETKEMLRKIPNNGLGFGLLKDSLASAEADICFNYLGQMDAELQEEERNAYSTGKSISDKNTLQGNINVDGIILENKLSFTVTYNQGKYNVTTMKKLVKQYKQYLTDLIRYCTEKEETVKTVSDYGSTQLETSEFSEIMDIFNN